MPPQTSRQTVRYRIASPRRLLAAALCLPLQCLSLAASAQTAPSPSTAPATASHARIASLLDALAKVHTPTAAAISPDGNYVAWAANGQHGSELHLTGIAPAGAQDAAWDRVLSPDTIANVTSLSPGACTASHPNWSPDGKQLAFLSNCSGSGAVFEPTAQDNIFIWTLATNAIRQLSHLHGEVSSLAWSPDGRSIGFLYVENATRQAGALDAMKPWSGVIGEDNIEVQQLWTVRIDSGAATSLTPKDLHVYEFAWSPDAKRLTYVAAKPPGEDNWWSAKLYSEEIVDTRTYADSFGMAGTLSAKNADKSIGVPVLVGSAPQLLFDPTTTPGPLRGLQIALPRFSPDGSQIAFIGGLMSDQGATGGDIYLIPTSGLIPPGASAPAEPKDLTPDRPASPAWFTWLNDHTLGISEHTGGSTHLTALDLRTGKDIPSIDLSLPETIIAGPDVMSVSISSSSTAGPSTRNIALIRQSFAHPPEVWAGPLDNLKQLTHLNDSLKPAWGKAESIDYTNGGFHIQGWLLYPAGWTPSAATSSNANAKKYPLIVAVHGGPSAAVTPRWPTPAFGGIPFSALGYFVFMPNPRGSYGQGEKFTQANIKDFGYGDLSDILAGIDLLEKRFPIDPAREGLTGWSYGGFMTMFGVTQTTRFKAAVAGAGISNWQSYYGENSIDQWMVPFFGTTVYDDPKVYARSSPIDFIKQVKTPTLVLVGDRDGECPAPQSFEFWHALRAEDVKTQLVIYPNEGHHIADPAHQRDVLQRALDWFETQMPATQPPPNQVLAN